MTAAIPTAHQSELISRLRDTDDRRAKDALTELVVHEGLLQAGRTDIEVAPTTAEGATDYRLTDLGLHLEVTRAGVSDQKHGEQRRRLQVLQGLNQVNCGRFSLRAAIHGAKGTPSVKTVRADIETWIATLDPVAERTKLETDQWYEPPSQAFTFDDWKVTISATPLRADAETEPVLSTILETLDIKSVSAESVKNTLKKKRTQHAALTEPLLIVIDVSAGHLSDAQVADALYGRRPLIGWDPPRETGLWNVPERTQTPTEPPGTGPDIVGVMVLDHLHFTGLDAVEATLWLPPDSPSPLPDSRWRTARCDPKAQWHRPECR
ncbi:hypothetical protein [Nocardioides marmorisolisilvae]|uniref:hypothetical protein n=1 Tax=Nocardioides marmorisolisilvae TaxID=1542737 RepID=UPI0011CDCDE0|nr:hypothetical protein [Nocardioides marmorisolisilvae]